MDRNLALEVVRVTEAAALAAARQMGRGDEMAVDIAAAEAMECAFDAIPVAAVVAIGEGTEDEEVHLRNGQKIGAGNGPALSVALDSVEGSMACATGGANALSVIAISDDSDGGFLSCPRTYMDKIAVGPAGAMAIDLDRSPTENLKALAEAQSVYVEDLTVGILDRPRHGRLIDEVRSAGARIRLLADGDVSAALATTVPDSGIDLLMGSGGASQGILAAAAMLCAGGNLQARFAPANAEEQEQLEASGVGDLTRKLEIGDLVRGSVMFAATGVTTGDFLRGVQFVRGGATTHSVVMRSKTRTVRHLVTEHHFDRKPQY
jgi:fructose-1,6-bisphosphatase II